MEVPRPKRKKRELKPKDNNELNKLKRLSSTAKLDNLHSICDIGDAMLDLPKCGNNAIHGKRGGCGQCFGMTYREQFYRNLLIELKNEKYRRGGTKDISPYTNMGFHSIANILSLMDTKLKLLTKRLAELENEVRQND